MSASEGDFSGRSGGCDGAVTFTLWIARCAQCRSERRVAQDPKGRPWSCLSGCGRQSQFRRYQVTETVELTHHRRNGPGLIRRTKRTLRPTGGRS